MGSRRLRPMTAADLHLLPEPCARCAFWETSLSDLAAPTDHVDRGAVKAEWAEAVTRYWGYCGVMAFADDRPIGHLTLAPAMYVPRLGAFATTPVGPDAAVVMSAHVAAELRGKGLGKQLVHSAAGLVARRDIRALEAVGTYTRRPVLHVAHWVAPGGRLRGGTAPPDHSTAADGPAKRSALAAGSRCCLASLKGSRTPARISGARNVQPSRSALDLRGGARFPDGRSYCASLRDRPGPRGRRGDRPRRRPPCSRSRHSPSRSRPT